MEVLTIQAFCVTNPLVGLSPTALRLYSALEVFRDVHSSEKSLEWFRAPQRDKRLQQIGFSGEQIHQGLAELVNAGLLQIRNESEQWYQLK